MKRSSGGIAGAEGAGRIADGQDGQDGHRAPGNVVRVRSNVIDTQ
jgi:hypothetical protein